MGALVHVVLENPAPEQGSRRLWTAIDLTPKADANFASDMLRVLRIDQIWSSVKRVRIRRAYQKIEPMITLEPTISSCGYVHMGPIRPSNKRSYVTEW
jgi:hypothetical protein